MVTYVGQYRSRVIQDIYIFGNKIDDLTQAVTGTK